MRRKVERSAEELLTALRGPIFNPVIRKEVGNGELDYEVYVQTRSLLSLQTSVDELVVPDELVFQVMHQTQELWLKVLAFEGVALVDALDRDETFAASATLERMIAVARCLASDIRVLHTLAPDVFQVIRRSLGNGSGLESPGYNQVLLAATSASGALERLVARRHTTLLDVYGDRTRSPELHRVAEQFVDLDEAFQAWLFAHFTLVRRTIGVDKTVRALDGFPTVALGSRMTKPLFPELWDVRVQMTRTWEREGGFPVGEPRVSAAAVSGTHVAVGAEKPDPAPASRPARG